MSHVLSDIRPSVLRYSTDSEIYKKSKRVSSFSFSELFEIVFIVRVISDYLLEDN